MKLLLVASAPMEFEGMLARPGATRLAVPGVEWARPVRLGVHEALLVANGVGARCAAAAVEAACQVFQPEAVISTGFCGALDPEFGLADVVVGTQVVGDGCFYPALAVTSRRAYRTGPVRSLDHVVGAAEEKGRLRASACAVEMEAAGVAKSVQEHGLPFYCIRVVTDLAKETMANDFNAALRSDGHFDTIVILRATLRRPWVRLPELLRLRTRCVRAARVLGDFFADCRF